LLGWKEGNVLGSEKIMDILEIMHEQLEDAEDMQGELDLKKSVYLGQSAICSGLTASCTGLILVLNELGEIRKELKNLGHSS
jgi:hypothetical protein